MLRSLAFPLFTALVLAFALSASASAQVMRVPMSGCPGAPFPQPVGTPAIGQGFGVIAAPCPNPTGQQFIVIGTPTRPLLLPVPPACVRGCTLDVAPLDVRLGGAWRVLIPNDPALIGACFRVQAGCVDALPGGPLRCVLLQGALDVCITR
ncbi:MAG: hypothetical protein IPM29_29355 [Planctomycetes bacterium]|nr:hypothetical protein [Planctomycetota bacterium]